MFINLYIYKCVYLLIYYLGNRGALAALSAAALALRAPHERMFKGVRKGVRK